MTDDSSPNDQIHEVGEPQEVSVNWTVNGVIPEVGVPVNEAPGAGEIVVGIGMGSIVGGGIGSSVSIGSINGISAVTLPVLFTDSLTT
ncbi:MAG: hypothetical protein STSR0009_09950 [Methanoregula sp.]